MEILKRAVIGFKQKNLTDWSAALTYYSVLSLFPASVGIGFFWLL
jgi:uncharacterized BrkB/YihY/UPF0761 family membrane protein